MDDGGGAAISWRALEVLKQLNLTPRRTVKTVLWTAEELGSIGGRAFFQKHKGNASKAQLILESDIGTFTPLGLSAGIKNKEVRPHLADVGRVYPCLESPDITV